MAAHDSARPKFPVSGSVVAVIALGLLAWAAIFFREIQAAVDVWNASTAYSHCYLVLPMALYLLWDRKVAFEHVAVRSAPIWALAAIPLALVWLTAERLGFMEGRQLAAVAGVEVLLLAVLGAPLFRRISGPLLFLFFLVPFGAFVTPILQQFTATFSTIGLDLMGIPNYSDKFTIETPAGTFFVAEACAGLRFLIAAIAFGVFYALLSYTSPARRIGFIAASIVVPVVANGFRALGIILLGQILGSAEAAAADHIVYGWVFFSVVMLLLIAAGQLFRENAPGVLTQSSSARTVVTHSARGAALAVISILAIAPVLAATIDSRSAPPALHGGEVIAIPGGCTLVASESKVGSNQRRDTVTCGKSRLEVSVMLFSPRSTSSAIISERRQVTREIGAEDATVAAVSVPPGAGAWTIIQTTDPNQVTAYASWIDGQPNISGLAGRLAQARNSLLGSNRAPALITISSAEPPNVAPVQRKATLDQVIALVQAQGDLNARMAVLTRVGSD